MVSALVSLTLSSRAHSHCIMVYVQAMEARVCLEITETSREGPAQRKDKLCHYQPYSPQFRQFLRAIIHR